MYTSPVFLNIDSFDAVNILSVHHIPEINTHWGSMSERDPDQSNYKKKHYLYSSTYFAPLNVYKPLT